MATQAGLGKRTPSADISDKIRIFGLGEGSSVDRVKPFRLSTMQEMLIQSAIMRGNGLGEDEFAKNPWGFPFIPFPQANAAAPGVMLPPGTPISIGQHPIFWIDEALTTPTRDEENDPARWCVRMFYLIAGFGLWNKKLQWISAPCMKLKIERVGGVDYENYIKGFDSNLSQVRFAKKDLYVPLDDIEVAVVNAVARCTRIQRESWDAYRLEQLAAYQYATSTLSDPDNSAWNSIADDLANQLSSIAEASRKQYGVSTKVEGLYDSIGSIVEYLDNMETNNLILSAVSLKNHSANMEEYNRITVAIRQFREKVTESGYRRRLEETAATIIESASPQSTADDFAKLYRVAEDIYIDVQRRLRLQVVNFARVINDQDPFDTFTEMEVVQSTEDGIGETNLPSLEAIRYNYSK